VHAGTIVIGLRALSLWAQHFGGRYGQKLVDEFASHLTLIADGFLPQIEQGLVALPEYECVAALALLNPRTSRCGATHNANLGFTNRSGGDDQAMPNLIGADRGREVLVVTPHGSPVTQHMLYCLASNHPRQSFQNHANRQSPCATEPSFVIIEDSISSKDSQAALT
jgi:hypothetical protein